jgi:peptidyl-prolyl cis-trans isomerase SurA
VSQLKIAVLVNDDPITQYEIAQRAALLAGGAALRDRAQETFKNLIKRKSTNERLRAILKQTIDANRGKSREQILKIFEKRKQAFAHDLQRQAVASAKRAVLPTMRRRATEELIEERLKIQAAKRNNMLISDEQVDNVMAGIAKRNKMSLATFKQQLRRQGTDVNSMRNRLRANMSWMRLVNAKFGRFVDVSQKTIDESVAETSGASNVSLHLHRLTFQLPDKIDQRIIAQRMVEADQLRARFTGCDASRALARSSANVIFQDLGYKIATTVQEPTRSLLINLRDGEMTPPVTTEDGVALYAVCARRSGTKSFEARAAAERELRQKGTELYARKYLSDLRRDAHIEYRTR